MSQDVCHRQRRSLNGFQSGRAQKTRAEHVQIKSCCAGTTPREALHTVPMHVRAASCRTAPCTDVQLNCAINTFVAYYRYIRSALINITTSHSTTV
ncbi:unnamed protein product [Arctia plantaginis]|uniref:Uncharacterized protein n=1 Tax=Arctia plantaginis TaxID=874455 RepID=A0A8S1ATI5_ARCPL|nr:unnamed protein product [Arctia plantaginis]